jgi:hypothetical protein
MLPGSGDASIDGISDFNLNPAVRQMEYGWWRKEQSQINYIGRSPITNAKRMVGGEKSKAR